MRIATIIVKTAIAIIFATSTAFARVPKTEGTKLIISVKSTEDQKEDCGVVRSSLFALIKNQLRFVPRVTGPAAFDLTSQLDSDLSKVLEVFVAIFFLGTTTNITTAVSQCSHPRSCTTGAGEMF